MNKLFIYYSLTGNGDVVANYLKDKGFEIRKVEMKKPLPKKFFFRVMSGGFLAGINAKSKLKEFDKDISKYDEVVIGSPIWNGRLSTPINTVLSELDLSKKKVSFVFYAGSGEGPKAVKKITKLYGEVKYTLLKEPQKYLEELKKLD